MAQKNLILETERLILRPYRKDDFEAVHSYASLPTFSQYDVWGPNTEQDTRDFLDRSIEGLKQEEITRFVFAITMKGKDRAIGGCGLYREGQRGHVAFFGYSVHPDFQGQGIATELSRALIDFGFNRLGLLVLYATCDTRNQASYRVMEKLGLQRVGFIKDDKEIRGQMRDSYRYEITRSIQEGGEALPAFTQDS